jgi:hypothetical protein
MAEVIKFQSQRLFQAQEFGGWETHGVSGAGNFTGVCAHPDPFAPAPQACRVNEVSFTQDVSGAPKTSFTVQKFTGGSLVFFVAYLFVR